MSNIYIVSELFYPNRTSTAYIMTEIAKYLSKKHSVSVICSDAAYDSNYDKDADSEELQSIKIIKKKASNGNKNTVLGKIRNAIGNSLSFGASIIKDVKAEDTVLAVTNPFLLIIVLAIIRRFKKFKYTLLVHDVFPENTIPAGLMTKNGFSYRLMGFLYNWAYGVPDQLLVLGRDMQSLIRDKTKNRKPVIIVENWYDVNPEQAMIADRNKYLGKDLRNKIIIGFAGNIGRVQNLSQFIRTFKDASNGRLHLVIVGDGANREEVEYLVSTMDSTLISYLGPRARSEQSLFLNCFDVGLITLKNGMYGLGVPSKTYNLLAIGKPLLFIGDHGSEIDLLINESEVGWTFNWMEEKAIIDFLKKLNAIPQKMVSNAKDLALTSFSEEIIMSKIEKLLCP